MSHHPFRKFGHLVLAACAVCVAATSLSAQTTTPSGTNPSRFDVFVGYTYLGAHGVLKPQGTAFTSVNKGAVGGGTYWFNRYVGMEATFFANPSGVNDAFYGGYAGPAFRAPMQNFTLWAHGMAGGVKGTGPDHSYPIPPAFTANSYTWGPSVLVGGGMDYDLPFFHHHLGLRLFEADYRYIHEDFGPVQVLSPIGGRLNLSSAELSTGLLFHFGSIVPPPPVAYSCAVTMPTGTIYSGDVITITGTATNLNPKKTATYTWVSDGGTVTGTSNVASIDTKSLSAGSYTVKGHVSEGSKPGEMADCSVPFMIAAIQPPTIGCSADPSTVKPGDPSTITAAGLSPQNRPLTYSYSSTAGSISGNTATAILQTTGVAPGTISVTCNVVDDKGQTASQQTTVTVSSASAPPAPVTAALCTISFDRDKKRPTRVDNEAKACLDDIALNAQRQSDAKLAITGNSAPVMMGHGRHKEDKTAKVAAERAVNEKAYLVGDKGIDSSRISVYTGTAGTDTAATTLIPVGSTLDNTGLTPVDESAVKAVPRTAGHMKHKK